MFNLSNRKGKFGAAGALAIALLLPATAALALPPPGQELPIPPPTTRPPTPPTTPPTTPTPPVPVPSGGLRYKLEAISFTADDESGVDFFGSDEPVWVFTSKDGAGSKTVSQAFGDIDSGDTAYFTTAKCLSTNCTTGVTGPFALATQLVEKDGGSEASIRANVRYGITAAHWIARAFGVDSSVLDTELEDFFTSLFADDLMGSSSVMWADWELRQALPYVGATYTETLHLGERGGDLPDWLDNPPDYTLRLRLTRMPDAPPVALP